MINNFLKQHLINKQKMNQDKQKEQSRFIIHPAILCGGVVCLSSLAVAGYAFAFYKICRPTEYIIRTGLGIKTFQIKRSCVRWPLQKITRIDMSPFGVTVNIDGPTSDLIPTSVPISFTMRPNDPNENKEGFDLYIKRMSSVLDESHREKKIMELLEPCVKGEGRTLIANIAMEKLFADKQLFKSEVEKILVGEISKYGLEIQNVCIQNLEDTPGNEYFSKLKQRALKNAEAKSDKDVAIAERDKQIGITTSLKEQIINVQKNEMEREISVAESKREKEVGIAQNAMEQQITIAEQNKKCTLSTNIAQADIERSNAELEVVKAESKRKKDLATIEATASNEGRMQELMKQVEEKRREQEEAKHRAELMSKAVVQTEIIRKMAEAELYKRQTEADALMYTRQKEADALGYTKQKEAEGQAAIYETQAKGITNMIAASRGDTKFLSFYLGLQSDLYPKLAKEAANAIQGMQPKITMFTGGDGPNAMDSFLGMTRMGTGLEFAKDMMKDVFSGSQTKEVVQFDTKQKEIVSFDPKKK